MTNNRIHPSKLFQFQMIVLNFLGFRMEYGRDLQSIFAFFRAFYILIIIFVINMIFMIYFILTNLGNLEYIVTSVPPFAVGSGLLTKLFGFVVMRHTIRELMDDMVLNAAKGNVFDLFSEFGTMNIILEDDFNALAIYKSIRKTITFFVGVGMTSVFNEIAQAVVTTLKGPHRVFTYPIE